MNEKEIGENDFLSNSEYKELKYASKDIFNDIIRQSTVTNQLESISNTIKHVKKNINGIDETKKNTKNLRDSVEILRENSDTCIDKLNDNNDIITNNIKVSQEIQESFKNNFLKLEDKIARNSDQLKKINDNCNHLQNVIEENHKIENEEFFNTKTILDNQKNQTDSQYKLILQMTENNNETFGKNIDFVNKNIKKTNGLIEDKSLLYEERHNIMSDEIAYLKNEVEYSKTQLKKSNNFSVIILSINIIILIVLIVFLFV
ncbi:hypothetical protein BUZ83_12245 [Staphylococcus saprophyticus]|uniref:hypothetical protein n=1 Tax=Staphylococcus saprophyticus TaxID=29385 RepID=UPI000D1DD5D9|nr:hypothetical protein [Staphylococcus saprophyticus]MDW3898414.1 hypothetical protein [Staphylococcus saprophyticus]MEB7998453.1 hypothetical protein [Staphylococcus saprophyticus]PTK02243.1 hypothetical protein BUZ73_10685 [Staphylococcus saprophyticus]PTK11010.1 hypothetical protein BUZ75_10725 [Staphylococcus saprophyticus]RIO19701.1 hypothetical protein BUZ83_12245 [Staphylococcus saprophyticus]